jgi:hypothetical protein
MYGDARGRAKRAPGEHSPVHGAKRGFLRGVTVDARTRYVPLIDGRISQRGVAGYPKNDIDTVRPYAYFVSGFT